MEKPKPFIYWTDKHRTHNWAGVLVVGRQVIPVVLFYILSGIATLVTLLYGFIATPKHPEDGYITDFSAFIPFWAVLLTVLCVAGLLWIVVGVRLLVRYTIDILKNARDGLDI